MTDKEVRDMENAIVNLHSEVSPFRYASTEYNIRWAYFRGIISHKEYMAWKDYRFNHRGYVEEA